MLFNSLEFLLLFIPLCVITFYLCARISPIIAITQLLCFSLIFYGFSNPAYLILLCGSIIVNFALGNIIHKTRSRFITGAGIACNLISIGYFKYFDFFIETSNGLFATNIPLQSIILPLGISFFTFQQISYLIECYRKDIKQTDFLHYALFVSFFPQLVAGPIVRFNEIVPQFYQKTFGTPNWSKILIGLILFSIGLSKKVFVADAVAIHATDVFTKADSGQAIGFFESWYGSFAYSFQIYFDFSAYSDMAIGLALMLGLSLPVNFLSPYKSKSIIEFWRTWHITLSRFLRDYLYYPLGGNRKGKTMRYANLMIVMLLGGLWHGASWNFVIWGGLHGVFLMINHLFLRLSRKTTQDDKKENALFKIGLTFLSITVAWVFFRAETIDGAITMIYAMTNPFLNTEQLISDLVSVPKMLSTLVVPACLIWLAPNASQIKSWLERTINETAEESKNSILYASICASIALSLATFFIFAGVYSEFIYFQF